jgi:hypothetical protein
MSRRHVGQAVGGLEPESAPDMGVIDRIEIYALVASALDTHRLYAGQRESPAHPAGEVFVGGHREMGVEVAIIEGGDASGQRSF